MVWSDNKQLAANLFSQRKKERERGRERDGERERERGRKKERERISPMSQKVAPDKETFINVFFATNYFFLLLKTFFLLPHRIVFGEMGQATSNGTSVVVILLSI